MTVSKQHISLMNMYVLTLKYRLLICVFLSLFFLSFPMKLISDKLFLFSCLLAEEREKPELLAESPERRKRVAQDSGKTEQQVMDCWVLVSFWNFFTTPE